MTKLPRVPLTMLVLATVGAFAADKPPPPAGDDGCSNHISAFGPLDLSLGPRIDTPALPARLNERGRWEPFSGEDHAAWAELGSLTRVLQGTAWRSRNPEQDEAFRAELHATIETFARELGRLAAGDRSGMGKAELDALVAEWKQRWDRRLARGVGEAGLDGAARALLGTGELNSRNLDTAAQLLRDQATLAGELRDLRAAVRDEFPGGAPLENAPERAVLNALRACWLRPTGNGFAIIDRRDFAEANRNGRLRARAELLRDAPRVPQGYRDFLTGYLRRLDASGVPFEHGPPALLRYVNGLEQLFPP